VQVEGLLTELIFEHALRVRVKAHNPDAAAKDSAPPSDDASSTDGDQPLSDASSETVEGEGAPSTTSTATRLSVRLSVSLPFHSTPTPIQIPPVRAYRVPATLRIRTPCVPAQTLQLGARVLAWRRLRVIKDHADARSAFTKRGESV
jgi:hypothetical protein